MTRPAGFGGRLVRSEVVVTESELERANDEVARILAAVGKAMREVVDGGGEARRTTVSTMRHSGGVLVQATAVVRKAKP